MPFSISPQDEQVLRDAVAAGLFNSEEDALGEALRLLREQSQGAGHGELSIASREKWMEDFLAWVDKPRKGNADLDDGRESIYE